MTGATKKATSVAGLDGYKSAPPRPAGWVAHQNVAPDWSALRQQSIIEIVTQGCLEDPWRPALIIEDGLTITRLELLERCQRFAGYLRAGSSPATSRGDARQPRRIHDRAVRHRRQPRHPRLDRADGAGNMTLATSSPTPAP